MLSNDHHPSGLTVGNQCERRFSPVVLLSKSCPRDTQGYREDASG
jgi:hypothetical protein